MKNVLKTILVAAGTVLASTVAQANLITGSVNMSGTLSINTTSLQTATAITNFVNSGPNQTTVSSGTGTYLGTSGALVTWKYPISLAVGAQVISDLWTFDAGTYTFSLASITQDTQNANLLFLVGSGTLTAPGFSPTVGNFTLTVTDSSGGSSGTATFGFGSSDTAVPDGGLTVALMGGALLGLGAVRRKLGC